MSIVIVEPPTAEIVGTLENLIVVEQGSPVVISAGAQGPPGRDGTGDKNYVHDQMIADATWTVVHNLSKYPSVTVIDSGGSQCEGSIVYDSTNQLTLTFSSAFGGKAFVN